MANTRELAQFASFVDFTGTSIGFSTQFNVSGVSTFTNAVIFDSTGSIQIPKGTTGQRLSGVLGQIRYNTSLSQFEGYGAGNAWGSLGGVTDVDADTFIRAESAAGEDEDKLEFVTANSTRVTIDSTGKVGIGSTIPTVTLDVVGNAKVSGVLTATTFSGSLATTDLTGTITNDQLAGSIANDKLAGSITNDKLAGSIANDKLANSTVSYGGVSLSLGGSDATPAFDLQDATGYPFTSLTGITTDIFGDTTPTLGGNLDANSKDITGVNNLNVSSASTFSGPISVGDTISLGDHDRLRFGAGNDLQIYHDGTDTWIDNSQGDLYIRSDGAGGDDIIIRAKDDVIIQAAQAEAAIVARGDGEVELYYDNSKKFETTGIGVSILSGAGLTATIAGPPNLVIDPGTVGDNTGNVRIKGDLFVDGTTTQINSTALEISDFIVGIATTATTDALADGAGIQIGPSGNTFLYDNTNEAFTSTENLNVASGHTYKIAGTDVLSNDTLGSNVVSSSLTSVGTLTGLTVSGDVSIADKIVHTGDTNTAIRFPAADTFTVETAGSEALRITSDGNVGIRTETPTSPLEIRTTTTNAVTHYRNNASNGGAYFGVRATDLGAASAGEAYVYSFNTGINLLADGTGHIDFATGGTASKVRIKSDGNVGIKTTSPNNTLTVSDTVQPSYAPSTAGNYIEIARTSGADAGLLINKNTGQWLVGIDNSDGANAPLRFEYGAAGSAHPGFGAGTLGMFMKHDGDIGIGTDNPAHKLDVIGGNIRVGKTSNGKYIAENSSGLSKVVIDSSGTSYLNGGDVGIGTDAPSGKLNVVGSDSQLLNLVQDSGDLQIRLNDRGTGSAYIKVPDNTSGSLTFETGGLERLRINSDGNIGIGTNNATHRATIHVNGTGSQDALFIANQNTATNNTANIIFGPSKGVAGGRISCIATEDFSISANRTADLSFDVRKDGTFSEALRITSSGNIGIGTDNPGTKLHVEGTGNESITLRLKQGTTPGNYSSLQVGRTDGAGNPHITDAVTGGIPISGIPGILLGSSNTGVPAVSIQSANSSNGHIVFSPKGTEKLRITSGGDILVNHTDSDGSGKLQVFTNSQDGIDILGFSSGATAGGRLTFYRSKSTGVGNFSEVANGDSLGRIDWRGYNDDGTANNLGATIEALVSGDVDSTTDMPSDLVFKTSVNGSSSPTERLQITSAGHVNVLGGILNLGTADSSSGHLNAYENMSFNIDTDNDDTSRYFSFHTNSASASGTELVRITEGGNVGINDSDPTNPLVVKQSSANINLELHATSSGRGAQIMTHNDHATFYHGIAGDTTGEYLYYTANEKDHVFYTNATERLRITSAGDIQRPKSLSQEVSTSVSSTSATSCGSFAKATYRSAYVIAQITQGSSYQVGRYLVIHDGTTATTIEESAIATGDMLGTFSGVVSGSNVEFRVTMSSASSATVITKIESIVV